MSKWIDYKMDSRYCESPFLNPPKPMGGKGNFRKMDKDIYLGGGKFKSNWENQFITMPQHEFGSGIKSPKIGQFGMGLSYIGQAPFNTRSLAGMRQDYGGSWLDNQIAQYKSSFNRLHGGASSHLALSNSQNRFGYGLHNSDMPLQPPKSRYNSTRIAKDRLFFD
jgi:hypothetical protein